MKQENTAGFRCIERDTEPWHWSTLYVAIAEEVMYDVFSEEEKRDRQKSALSLRKKNLPESTWNDKFDWPNQGSRFVFVRNRVLPRTVVVVNDLLE